MLRDQPTYGSVCTGIGSPEVAWSALGWKSVWMSEIDAAACKVLAHRFPDVPNHGDMLLLAEKVRRREIPAPDILVGGTPCQSFSVAGLRGGLQDARGQLTIAFIDLANAIDEIRAADGLPPVIIIWENVPGVLNHVDNPFGCFLAGLAGDGEPLELGPRPDAGKSSAYWTWSKKEERHSPKWTDAGAAIGPQRAIAWRILDAQYVELAQRRRRVFVVASAREGFDPAAVLLEFDGVRRDSPPSREAGEGVAGTLDARAEGGGFPGTDGACSGHVVPAFRPGTGGAAGLSEAVPTWWDGRDVSQTLDAVLHKGQTMPEKNRFAAVLQPVCYANAGHYGAMGQVEVGDPLRAKGGDTGHGGETIVVHGTQDPCVSDNVAFALGRNNGGENVICFSSKGYGTDAIDDLSPTLRAGGHADSHANTGVPPAVAYSVALRGREGGATAELGDDLAGCLRASSGGGDKPHVLAPVTVMQTRGSNLDIDDHVTGTLGSNCDRASGSAPMVAATLESTAGRSRGAGTPTSMLATHHMAVRRLMPVECEALQGFPAGHTAVPIKKVARNKMRPGNNYAEIDGEIWQLAADGPRYKQCGNSMATKVMRWIGQRVAAQLQDAAPGAANDDADLIWLLAV